jgi:predicted ATPase
MTKDTLTTGVRDGSISLIGREAELALLEDTLASVASEGKTRIVTILGPAGIGKSRLVSELVTRARTRTGKTPRIFRALGRDGAASFALFGRLLRARFGLVEGMDLEVAKAQVRTQVAKVLEDRKVGDVVYYLGQFLGLPFDPSPLTRAIDDDAQESELLRRAIFKAFLEADAGASPLCLIFEDLHAVHDDSLALLRYLLEYMQGSILVINTARTELVARHEDWARVGERRHTILDLPALDDDAAAQLVSILLAPCANEGVVPPELIEAACSVAAGNPMLLEQMVRALPRQAGCS